MIPGIRLGLDRIRSMLSALGHPEEKFASVIVTGTNGKGSVSAFLASILRCAGLSIGHFTSPHLVHVTERVKVDARKIDPRQWRELKSDVLSLSRRRRIPLTEFETQALIAFAYFARKSVDLAVLEVGLGGRLDAVNAHPWPEASAIVSLGLDHQEYLGPTLRHVLREKWGVIRAGQAAFAGFDSREIRSLSRRDLVPLHALGNEFSVSHLRIDWTALSQTFRVSFKGGGPLELRSRLLGVHQAQNAAIAAALARSLKQRGWPVADEDVRRGVRQARWPGRFDVVMRDPPAVLDGAHNPAAVAALARLYRQTPWGKEKPAVIFGCLKDKDLSSMVRLLSPLAESAFTLPLPTSRSRTARELASAWPRSVPARACAGFGEAWAAARAGGRPVLATGSLYLVGEAVKFLKIEA